MKKVFCLFFVFIAVLLPVIGFAAGVPSVTGKWGYVNIAHQDSGSWGTTAGTLVFNDNGTGTDTYQSNDGGTLTSKSKSFTYVAAANRDGSFSLTMTYADGTNVLRIVKSGDGQMLVMDGASDTSGQGMMIAVKMDPSKTYANSDLSGDYYAVGYEYDSIGTNWPGHYISWSGLAQIDGMGNMLLSETGNADGTIGSASGVSSVIHVSSDGSVTGNGSMAGYMTGDGKLAVFSSPGVTTKWQIAVLIRRADKSYSTSDLAGTWAISKFGDQNGNSFEAFIGTLTCDSSGSCVFATKNQTDGNIVYNHDGNSNISVSPDGSFGGSLSPSYPSYAAALGNNGNTVILNPSFDQNKLTYRGIIIGERCSNCFNIQQELVPMMSFSPVGNGNGLNISLYNPLDNLITTVKDDSNSSWWPSLNREQTFMVYPDGLDHNPYPIMVYDIAQKTSSMINNETSLDYRSAYFDDTGVGNVLFVDPVDGAIKKMNSGGMNVTTVAVPIAPYTFDVFWLSPDRQLIVAVEQRQQGQDYYTGHYERIVLIDPNSGFRLAETNEYLGEWNNASWRPDSTGFLYYHHIFNVVGGVYQGKTPRYEIYNWSGSSLLSSDISASPLGSMDENICVFTVNNHLLSLSLQKLYDLSGQLIADRSSDVPQLMSAMFGFDGNGNIYFADLDGSNFRIFRDAPMHADPTKIGVFNNGMWYLDSNMSWAWDGTPTDTLGIFGIGLTGAIPVVGDWNGDGNTKIGAFMNGYWYLDMNRSWQWDGEPTDKMGVFGIGLTGAIPVVGDWNGDGTTKIGIYQNGVWYLDMNNNWQWDGEAGGDKIAYFGVGLTGAVPVVGDWNGDGKTKIGIYQNGYWYLDVNGNGQWDGEPTDQLGVFGIGLTNAVPVVGDWNGDGISEIGIYQQGLWYLDKNRSWQWEGEPDDQFGVFGIGLTGAVPVPGKW